MRPFEGDPTPITADDITPLSPTPDPPRVRIGKVAGARITLWVVVCDRCGQVPPKTQRKEQALRVYERHINTHQ